MNVWETMNIPVKLLKMEYKHNQTRDCNQWCKEGGCYVSSKFIFGSSLKLSDGKYHQEKIVLKNQQQPWKDILGKPHTHLLEKTNFSSKSQPKMLI